MVTKRVYHNSMSFFKKSLIVFIAIITALIIIEISLRLFNPQLTLSRAQAFNFNCFERGTRRWIKLTANKTCLLSSPANPLFHSEIKTNSLGLRNPEIGEKKPDTNRILFIGDSFTMGWAVDEQEAFPRLVEKMLKTKNPSQKTETINAGFTAAGPSGYYLYYKNFTQSLAADTVIVNLYLGNDITSRLDVAWVKKDSRGFPEVVRSKSSYIDFYGQLRRKDEPVKYQIPLLNESHAFVFLMDRLTPLSNANEETKVITPLVCLFKKRCQDLNQAKQEVEQLLLEMNTIAKKRKQRFIVTLIPVEFQLYDEARQKYGIMIPLSMRERALPNFELRTFFDKNGIEYLDLLPDFYDHLDANTYYTHDDHWNTLGHFIAAEAITSYLSETPASNAASLKK